MHRVGRCLIERQLGLRDRQGQYCLDFLGNHPGFRHALFEVGVTADAAEFVQRIVDFLNICFHAGIGAAVPGSVGVGMAVVAEFVPALSATIGHMQTEEVMLPDTLVVIEVSGQIARPLKPEAICFIRPVVIHRAVTLRSEPAIGITFDILSGIEPCERLSD